MTIPEHIREFWEAFLDSPACPAGAADRFDVTFRIGTTDEDADEGARLILAGEKTATSSLLWNYEDSGDALPYVGALSVLEDGRRQPLCVIETTWVETVAFDDIDAEFARQYCECDGTLAGWRAVFWQYYSEQCLKNGRQMTWHAPMVCERFRVVFRRGQG